ncbi:hypothetical protein EMIT093MI4_60083 [Pseudomonas sp. IT-93MI4]|uniref:hypothetical protein n=1 Tax=unclassified Pseudomonas TaxID=196821 RepID=UPI0025523DD8|nr:hypothetical protein [Pseudomonas sp. lyk4-TYG-107]
MSSDLTKFQKLLSALHQDGTENLKTKITRMPIIKNANWIHNADDIKTLTSSNSGDFGDKIISLNPPSRLKDSVIGLWCRWDFEKPYKSKVEIMVCRGKDAKAGAKSYGFRIDPPHFQGDQRHNYWHAQYIQAFEKIDSIKFPLANNVDWIDGSVPAHPIVFSEPENFSITDTTIYAALSIYGASLPPNIKTVAKLLGLNKNFEYILSKVT